MKTPVVAVEWLGRVDYQTAWDLQKRYVAELSSADSAPHRLLLLEHPPTYTLGRRGKLENLLFDDAQLSAEGITVYHVDRGGDITYHGPGQLVGYPILNLKRLYNTASPDLHAYLRRLEQVLIDTLAVYDIVSWRFPGYTGVWVGAVDQESAEAVKIAAIGVKVSGQGITSHGFALNVNPNLDHFSGIIPCGIEDHGVTSMAHLLPDAPTVASLVDDVSNAFSNVFQVEARLVSPYNHPSTIG
jgi:lipoate-protein ligase B